MAYANAVERGLDYYLCHYGSSRLTFRGPRKRAQGTYVAFLGGTETFGKFIEDPFPDLVQEALGIRSINFGLPNAGLDAFLGDPAILDIAARARFSTIQILGAHNLSNRFYKVHPRHNDRFVCVTPMMRKVYPEVDFTEFHYTRHMLGALAAESRQRFGLIRDELRKTWVARMNLLTARLGTKVFLVWIGDRSPDDAADWIEDGEPLFVDRAMLNALRGRIAQVVEMPPSTVPDLGGKVFGPGEEAAALRSPGPSLHEALSLALGQAIASAGLNGG